MVANGDSWCLHAGPRPVHAYLCGPSDRRPSVPKGCAFFKRC